MEFLQFVEHHLELVCRRKDGHPGETKETKIFIFLSSSLSFFFFAPCPLSFQQILHIAYSLTILLISHILIEMFGLFAK